jgi:hypothetical protein
VERRSTTPRLDLRATVAGHSRLDLLEHGSIVALLAIWAVPFTRATGGRGVHNELLFVAALLVLLPAIRVWRAPTGSVVLAALTAAAALLVCVFAPSGWYGSDVAAGYAIAAAMFLAARRYVRDAERRTLIAAGVCLAGLYQFSQAFTAWWGGRDPAAEMSGTFYWHNPYAAFLLPGAIIGLGLILTRHSPWNAVGWVSTPLCTAGVVFSSSRATQAPLAVGFVLVLALGLRNRASVIRGIGATAATAAVTLALPGPPLFPHYSAPWAATAARGARQSLSQNGGFRTEFWREALQVAAHHPVVGSGYHVLATASALYTPSGWARSPQAHDGYLQALSDGGLLLGVPFLLAVAIVLAWALRRVWAAMRRRGEGQGPDIVQLCAGIALLGGLAHSAVDFDWSHPSILVEAALLAACVAPIARTQPRGGRIHLRLPAIAVLATVLVVLLPALHEWQADQPNLLRSTDSLLAESNGTFGDYRGAAAVLNDAAHGGRDITSAQAALALASTSNEARVDLHLALLRDAIGAQAGLISDAATDAQRQLRQVDGSIAPYVPDLALVEVDVGETAAARQLLETDIATQEAHGRAAPDLNGEIALWAQRLGTGGVYACEYDTARQLLKETGVSTDLPKPSSACRAADQG